LDPILPSRFLAATSGSFLPLVLESLATAARTFAPERRHGIWHVALLSEETASRMGSEPSAFAGAGSEGQVEYEYEYE
jgi:hypothetical protein